MLGLVDFFEFEVIIAPELGVASSHGAGGFQQIVTGIAIAGFDELGVLGLEVARLVLHPDEIGIFGHRCLEIESMNIADFGSSTGE